MEFRVPALEPRALKKKEKTKQNNNLVVRKTGSQKCTVK